MIVGRVAKDTEVPVRLDPRTDGRPGPRPDVRERTPILRDLAHDFDFTQKAPPLVLPPYPGSQK